ncbi:MAG: hypothetical protein JWP81_4728 [Ferruginibacter sp.]|nr:hypothetical protein [Ferruginibacter sp.]
MKYNLCLTQRGYFADRKTYWGVAGKDVWDKCKYMCENFGANAVFIYTHDAGKSFNQTEFHGTYSHKYDNFRDTYNRLHKTFDF